MFPGLLRPDGMPRREAEFISVDLYSFLECQIASSFPAAEVMGLGCCKQEHLRQGAPFDRRVSCGVTLTYMSGARDMLGACEPDPESLGTWAGFLLSSVMGSAL